MKMHAGLPPQCKALLWHGVLMTTTAAAITTAVAVVDVPGKLRQGAAGGAHVERARERKEDPGLVEEDATLQGGVVRGVGPGELAEEDTL